MFNQLHRGIDKLGELPGIRHLRQRRFERRFATDRNANYYLGVYATFEAAAAAAPPTKPIGYDNPESTTLYDEDIQPFLKDYPAALWLERSFSEGFASVFDLGGHIGVKYYAFDRILTYPKNLQWCVCDVVKVTSRGADLARVRDRRSALRFVNDPTRMSGFDLLYASGSLQYLPNTLTEILKDCSELPRRLVINTTALHPVRSFFTLNSIGTAFCPYRVQNETEFVEQLGALGYRVRDRWETPKEFVVHSLEEGYDLDRFVGLCLDRA